MKKLLTGFLLSVTANSANALSLVSNTVDCDSGLIVESEIVIKGEVQGISGVYKVKAVNKLPSFYTSKSDVYGCLSSHYLGYTKEANQSAIKNAELDGTATLDGNSLVITFSAHENFSAIDTTVPPTLSASMSGAIKVVTYHFTYQPESVSFKLNHVTAQNHSHGSSVSVFTTLSTWNFSLAGSSGDIAIYKPVVTGDYFVRD